LMSTSTNITNLEKNYDCESGVGNNQTTPATSNVNN
jgi:hypothetical protein